jgi:CubicO group peptidase (beta-lactamase class C family)
MRAAVIALPFIVGLALLSGGSVQLSGDFPEQAALQAIVVRAQAAQHIPTLSVAINLKGRLYSFGARRVYALGSLTKSFTAAAVLELAARRRIDLNSKLSVYVPEYRFASQVRIAELLDQTSGVPNYLADSAFVNDVVGGRNPAPLAALNRMRLRFSPGTRYEYSNGNYYLLSLLISKLSACGYECFVRRSLLEPLRLRGTYMEQRDVPAEQRATGYTKITLKPVAVEPLAASLAMGAAQMWSDAPSIAIWQREFFESALTMRERTLVHRPLADGQLNEYTAGWLHARTSGIDYWWHNGLTPGYSAAMLAVPSRHVYVVVLANADYADPNAILNEITALALRSL